MKTNEIRKKWVSFFKNKKHLFIEPSSLVPIEDDSLLWINSGVATLKKYFEGKEVPPSKRMVNFQKAIRTNDIENVGVTSRHHTLFEMLGNFSIGDYFRDEAIEYAFEFLTSSNYLNIDLKKLYFTVYENDQETYDKWIEVGVSKNKIFKMGRKTNFWDIGKGPSGPSTEIFFDRGVEYDSREANLLIPDDIENDRFVEIWNIVLSSFNNDGNGNYTDLPQKNIDTGAGLERLASCLQQTPTNFEIDIFKPIIKKIEEFSSKKYLWEYIPERLRIENNEQFIINSNFKSIADFSRMVIFAISDNALPSSNGRGYVIRKLLRKSIVNSRNLDINDNFIYKIVDIVADIFLNSYPNIKENSEKIKRIILDEEKQFNETLNKSLKMFSDFTNTFEKIKVFNEEKAFKLFETYGLPLEIIYDLTLQKGIKLNKEKIDLLFDEFKAKSSSGEKVLGMENQNELFTDFDKTNFIGYQENSSKSKVIGVKGEFVVFDKTPFYATSGGQEHDNGKANNFCVTDVFKNINGTFIHKIEGNDFNVGDEVELIIDENRRKKLTRNHSSVHLLFASLEKNKNRSVPQVGSKVEEEFFRFDFMMQEKIELSDLEPILKQANKWVKDATKTEITEVPIEEAKKMNAGFLQNAKYGKIVRVVKLNPETIDLCGGTHVSNTSEIEEIIIYKLEKKGSGVYRIEGTSGKENIEKILKQEVDKLIKKNLDPLVEKINTMWVIFGDNLIDFKKIDLKEKISNLKKINDVKVLESKLKDYYNNLNSTYDLFCFNKVKQKIDSSKNNIVYVEMNNFPFKSLNKSILKEISSLKEKIIIISSIQNEKVTISILVTKDFVDSKTLERNINLITKNGLNGNGKNQLYIYGGKVENLNKIKEELNENN